MRFLLVKRKSLISFQETPYYHCDCRLGHALHVAAFPKQIPKLLRHWPNGL